MHSGLSQISIFVGSTGRCEPLLETAPRAAVIFPRRIKALLQAGLAVRDGRDAGQLTQADATVKAGKLTDRLLDSLTVMLGEDNVRVQYPRGATA